MAAAPCAYSRKILQGPRRTSRRTATSAGPSLRDRTDRSWHRRARTQPINPLEHCAAPAPASARRRRRRAHDQMRRPFAQTRSWWRRCRSRHRSLARPPKAWRDQSGCRPPVSAGYPAPAAGWPSAGLPVRSSTQSDRRFDRGLWGCPYARAPVMLGADIPRNQQARMKCSSPPRLRGGSFSSATSHGLEGGVRIPECNRTGKRPGACPDRVAVIAALNDPLTILLADDFSDVVTPDDDCSDSRTTCIRPIVGPRSRKIIRRTGIATDLTAHVPPTPSRRPPGIVGVPTCIAQMVMMIRSGFRTRCERAKHSRCS